MPRLYLLRHAKAAAALASQRDHDRPLARRGHEDAALVGRYMAGHGFVPARVLCSPALRTRETFAALLPHLDPVPEVVFVDELYSGGAGGYLDALRREGGEAASLLVVGHNPATEVAARVLIADDSPARWPGRFATAALAAIDFAVPWSALKPAAGQLVAFVEPADLGGGPPV